MRLTVKRGRPSKMIRLDAALKAHLTQARSALGNQDGALVVFSTSTGLTGVMAMLDDSLYLGQDVTSEVTSSLPCAVGLSKPLYITEAWVAGVVSDGRVSG